MHSLSVIAPIFAKLDGNTDEVEAVEKALRNLVQRLPLAPSETVGRTFHYDQSAIVAIRLCYVAQQFGLSRVLLHPYALFLSKMSAQAIQNYNAGQDFAFHVVARPVGIDMWASWEEPADIDQASRADRANWRARKGAIELGRFTQTAHLVAQLLTVLQEA